jgi:UDP-N-acetylmuramoyl-L-alanyl-D-glutamate--2,6-diaminopimelate ligase
MRLSELISALPAELAPSDAAAAAGVDPLIRGICYDSRLVAPGDLFVALSGSTSDGHDYVGRAAELGAAAVMAEHEIASPVIRGLPLVIVPDSRRALAPVSMRFFGEPGHEMTLFGVTGTNGKTSTCYLIESILAAAGRAVGLIGTVEIRYADERLPAVNTTPESLDLQRTLRAMRTAGVESAVMEVSSHGLELGRVTGCRFEVSAFTNFTQDHLDFHGDMEAYLASKTLLFSELTRRGGAAVVNVDDPSAEVIMTAAELAGARVLRCSRRPEQKAEVELLEADVSLEGSRVRMALPGGTLACDFPLLGDFNLENLLVACGCASAAGIALEHIVAGVEACPQVPGRMEVVRAEGVGQPGVIVDYAHTPDAIDKLLAAVRPLAAGRTIAVFGCGGDRDRGKRPLMAQAVGRHADLAIVTSDNPRTEDPQRILDDVAAGLSSFECCAPESLEASSGCFSVIGDRRDAIRRAIALAETGDTVVIAGKGHEDYQIIGSEKRPFDDRVEARRALQLREGGA